jgi:hypothetical protein
MRIKLKQKKDGVAIHTKLDDQYHSNLELIIL